MLFSQPDVSFPFLVSKTFLFHEGPTISILLPLWLHLLHLLTAPTPSSHSLRAGCPVTQTQATDLLYLHTLQR